MDVFEIAGFQTGVSRKGVNFLEPADSFQNIENGYIYRQVLQSRKGFNVFAPRLTDKTRVFGIFEHIHPDGEKETLAIDQNFLYSYNGGTGVFDQIPFGGTLAAYTGFGITSKEFYVSGTSYPTATNTQRFIFTFQGGTLTPGGSLIFFYDGVDVKDFTSGDNPDYQAPALGALVKALYVIWFGERLNFFSPTIVATDYTQGILYSGIRNVAGNGDKFNVAGSGFLQADTYQSIRGATILGQIIEINFDRSCWSLEKTRDAFNPYFIREIPSVLGTDANFSNVAWNDTIRSIGRTGIIGTDGRQSLRVDNKIPYYTADEIDQVLFQLTYGGFERTNNQFLWSYKEAGADTDTQNKVLVNNYEEETWSTYDMRFSVFGQATAGLNLTWDDIYEVTGNPSWSQWNTTEELWDKIGQGKSVQKTLAGDDLGFIYELNTDYDDYYTDISAITQAAQAVLTVGESAFQVGDLVTVTNVQGMTEINNFDPSLDTNDGQAYIDMIKNFEAYEVVAATDTSITLNVDSTLFTAYTTGGFLSKIISFKAETIPFNPYRIEGRRCFISHVEFLIDTNSGHLKVDCIADDEEAPFLDDVLLLPTTTTKAREWITLTVNNEADFMTFVLKQESPQTQVKVTSMRIHCSPGGLTHG